MRCWDVGVEPLPTDLAGVVRGDNVWADTGHGAPLTCLAVSHDGRFGVSADAEGALKVWHFSTAGATWGHAALHAASTIPRPAMHMVFDREAWRLWVVLDNDQVLLLDHQ